MARGVRGQLSLQFIGISDRITVLDFAAKPQPLARGFIKLIKMLLAPVDNIMKSGVGMNIGASTLNAARSAADACCGARTPQH